MSDIKLSIGELDPRELFGQHDAKMDLIREAHPEISITSRGGKIYIKGDKKEAQDVKAKLERMMRALALHNELSVQAVEEIAQGGAPYANKLEDNTTNVIVYGRNGKPIKARTRNQKKLVDAVDNNDIVFAVGPAGTGKTYTAVALAVRALKNKLVRRIILTRPAVEAGENLGFLPGDLKDKVDPYLRPLYDALDDMLPHEKLEQFMATRIIEVAPLAFMRGRTLDNAFIILDEAQNTTSPQLRMFLTRLGPSAKAIINGDLTQIDLPRSQKSGLIRGLDLLDGVNGIGMVRLTAEDVVRHRLVKDIIKAYEISDKKLKEEREAKKALKAAERAEKE